GKIIASGDGKAILLWDVTTGTVSKRLDTGEESPYALAFSPDGSVLASANSHKAMRLWDTATGKELRRLEGETGFMACLTFSPDGKMIAGSCETPVEPRSYRSSLRIWRAATGKTAVDVPGEFNCAAYSPDGKLIATGGLETALVLDAATG